MSLPPLSILRLVLGCQPGHLSRVFTIKKRTYQVCLQCGHEVEYSWERMRSLRSLRRSKFADHSIADPGYAPMNNVRPRESSHDFDRARQI